MVPLLINIMMVSRPAWNVRCFSSFGNWSNNDKVKHLSTGRMPFTSCHHPESICIKSYFHDLVNVICSTSSFWLYTYYFKKIEFIESGILLLRKRGIKQLENKAGQDWINSAKYNKETYKRLTTFNNTTNFTVSLKWILSCSLCIW